MSRNEGARSLRQEVDLAIECGESGLSHEARNRWITTYSRAYQLTLDRAAERVDLEAAQLFKSMSLSKHPEARLMR